MWSATSAARILSLSIRRSDITDLYVCLRYRRFGCHLCGTTGYNATVDLRYQWMRQKRLQGSHFANDEQSYAMNDLAVAGKLDPCMSQAFSYDELPHSHQLMHDNKHPYGNMSILVGAREFGQGAIPTHPWSPRSREFLKSCSASRFLLHLGLLRSMTSCVRWEKQRRSLKMMVPKWKL